MQGTVLVGEENTLGLIAAFLTWCPLGFFKFKEQSHIETTIPKRKNGKNHRRIVGKNFDCIEFGAIPNA